MKMENNSGNKGKIENLDKHGKWHFHIKIKETQGRPEGKIINTNVNVTFQMKYAKETVFTSMKH